MSDNNRTYSEESGFFDILKSIMGRNPKKSKKKVLKNGSIVDSDYKYQKPAENTMGMTSADYAKFRKAVMYGNDEQNIRENLAKYFENNPKIKDMLTEADRVFNSIPKSEGDAQTRYRAALTKAMSGVDDPELNKLARVRKFSDSKINVIVNDYDSGKFTPVDTKGKKGKDSDVENQTEENLSEVEDVDYSYAPKLDPSYDDSKTDPTSVSIPEQGSGIEDLEKTKVKQEKENKKREDTINKIFKDNGLDVSVKISEDNGFNTSFDFDGNLNDYKKAKSLLKNIAENSKGKGINPDTKKPEAIIPKIKIEDLPDESGEFNNTKFRISMSNTNRISPKFNEGVKYALQNKEQGTMPFCLGKSSDGEVVADLNKETHLLFLGASQSGKSVSMLQAIAELMETNSPEDLRLFMIDGKGTELTQFNDSKFLADGIVNGSEGDPEAVIKLLKKVLKETNKRNSLFTKNKVKDLASWNKKFPDKKLPAIVLATDEMQVLLSSLQDKDEKLYKKAVKLYNDLLLLARSSGVHLFSATQNLTAEYFGAQGVNLGKQFTKAIVGRLDDPSGKMHEFKDAVNLRGKGDMLLYTKTSSTPINIQAPLLQEEDLDYIVKQTNKRITDKVDVPELRPKSKEEVQKIKEAEKLKKETPKEEPKKELKKLDDELKDAYIQPIKDVLNEIDPDDLDTLKDAVEKMADVKKNLDKRGIEVPEEITDIMEKFKPVMESGDDYERAFNLKKFLKGNVPENEWVQEQEDKESKLEKLPKNIKEAGKKRQQKESKKEPDYDLDVEEDEEDDVDNKVQKKMTKDKGNLIKQIQTFENKYKNKEGKPSKFNRVTEEKKKDFDDRLTKRKQQLSKKQSGFNKRKSNPDIIKRLKESIDKAKERQRISDNITKYEDEYSDRTGKDVKFRRTSKIVDDID